MNLRLEQNALRFRIQPEELTQLIAMGRLESATWLAETINFRFGLVCQEGPIKLTAAENSIFLEIAPQELKELQNRGKSKEGLTNIFLIQGNNLEVSLEVDIKKMRPASNG